MIRRPELPRWLSAVLALAAGLLIGLGQPPMGLWPATMVGVALFTWLLTRRRKRAAALYGLLAGVSMNTLTLHWIGVLGVPVAIGLIAYMSLWLALLAVVLSRLVRLPGWPLWAAAAWVAMEFVSGRIPLGGFQWTRLTYVITDTPLSGYLPYVGAAGVSFVVALLAHLLLAILKKGHRLKAGAALVAGFVVGGLLLLVPIKTGEQEVRVANITPNVNRHEYGTRTYARSVTNNALSATIMAMAESRSQGQGVDFVLWPESASDHDPFLDAEANKKVELAARLADAPVLVGAVTLPDVPDSRQTSAIWWDPVEGPGAIYHKQNLVPFGEWIPFRDVLLPRLPILEQVGRQGISGTEPGAMEAPVTRYPSMIVGTIICFEHAYDDTVYDAVRHGGNVIVSQSNENTYAGTFQIAQQLNMNRIRAKELQREVVVSTLNSISGYVDATGELHGATEEYTGAAQIVETPLRYRKAASMTVGPIVSWLAVAATGVGFIWAMWARTRESGTR